MCSSWPVNRPGGERASTLRRSEPGGRPKKSRRFGAGSAFHGSSWTSRPGKAVVSQAGSERSSCSGSAVIIDEKPKTFVLVFETNDELAQTVQEFAIKQELVSASFTSIGAFSSVRQDRANLSLKPSTELGTSAGWQLPPICQLHRLGSSALRSCTSPLGDAVGPVKFDKCGEQRSACSSVVVFNEWRNFP
jgi:hypothetical protein